MQANKDSPSFQTWKISAAVWPGPTPRGAAVLCLGFHLPEPARLHDAPLSHLKPVPRASGPSKEKAETLADGLPCPSWVRPRSSYWRWCSHTQLHTASPWMLILGRVCPDPAVRARTTSSHPVPPAEITQGLETEDRPVPMSHRGRLWRGH